MILEMLLAYLWDAGYWMSFEFSIPKTRYPTSVLALERNIAIL